MAKAATRNATPAKAGKDKSVETVTLKHIAAQIAEAHGLSKRQAEAALTDTVALIAKSIVKGKRVRFGNLGIFGVKKLAARKGRNPATGEAIKIKARKKVAFRPAKELKDAL
ncbi:DNA-binding protein HU-beta [Rhizobiales bacterium GAS113]|nr:DNA-binding protein HU-beta [Rhizobiales bacterium GAS113]